MTLIFRLSTGGQRAKCTLWCLVHNTFLFTATWETLDAEMEDGLWPWRLMAGRYAALLLGNTAPVNISIINSFFSLKFQRTFHYDSKFWSDKNVYNLSGGKTGFDSQETKLPTYWNTPFSKICLGMKINQQLKFIVIKKQSSSLYSLLADGKYRATSLGRNKWKVMGSQFSLQANCNKEGFNAAGSSKGSSRARIGILGNNENDCASTDSRIGFGTGGNHDDTITCGNYAIRGLTSDNGEKHIKAMGYILVQWLRNRWTLQHMILN